MFASSFNFCAKSWNVFKKNEALPFEHRVQEALGMLQQSMHASQRWSAWL